MYDLTPYRDPRHDGVWCAVSWHWRGSDEIVTVTGGYLHQEDGLPVLRCGIYDAGAALDLPSDWFGDETVLMVSELIDKQLRQRPTAVLQCPEGTLRIELTEPCPCTSCGDD